VASSLPVGAARRIRWTSVRTENSSNLAAGAKEMQKYSWKMVGGGAAGKKRGLDAADIHLLCLWPTRRMSNDCKTWHF